MNDVRAVGTTLHISRSIGGVGLCSLNSHSGLLEQGAMHVSISFTTWWSISRAKSDSSSIPIIRVTRILVAPRTHELDARLKLHNVPTSILGATDRSGKLCTVIFQTRTTRDVMPSRKILRAVHYKQVYNSHFDCVSIYNIPIIALPRVVKARVAAS